MLSMISGKISNVLASIHIHSDIVDDDHGLMVVCCCSVLALLVVLQNRGRLNLADIDQK